MASNIYQHCPICSKPILYSERYPRAVCETCYDKACDAHGRKLSFSNVSIDGGFNAVVTDTQEEYQSHTCYVEGVECWADEARFGGIVLVVMPKYLFSRFQANEIESLHRELFKVLNISQDQLQALYKVMQQEFEVGGYPEHTLPRNIFHSHDESFQKRYEEALVVGVDIPSLFERDDNISSKKTVIIFGQDPLRKSNKRVEEIGIATPYALHLKDCREKLRNTRLYFDLIKVLLDAGYRVYLTDISKVWVSEANCDRGIPLSKQDHARFIQVLEAESKIFEPVAVITWGQVASKAIKSINLNVRHLEFPHPSGAANGTWRKLMGKPATRENRINYWRQEVFAYLSRL